MIILQFEIEIRKGYAMKIVGIILLILQALSVYGGIVNGTLLERTLNSGIVALFGYFIFGITGVILIVISIIRDKKKNKKDN